MSAQQVDDVRRKLMSSIHKPVIDHAVERGFDRAEIEDVLQLCGGKQERVARMWKAFNEQPSQQDNEMFELAKFVEFIKEQQSKLVLRGPIPGGRRRRKAKKR